MLRYRAFYCTPPSHNTAMRYHCHFTFVTYFCHFAAHRLFSLLAPTPLLFSPFLIDLGCALILLISLHSLPFGHLHFTCLLIFPRTIRVHLVGRVPRLPLYRYSSAFSPPACTCVRASYSYLHCAHHFALTALWYMPMHSCCTVVRLRIISLHCKLPFVHSRLVGIFFTSCVCFVIRRSLHSDCTAPGRIEHSFCIRLHFHCTSDKLP